MTAKPVAPAAWDAEWTAAHARLNASTRKGWERYQAHRTQVMQLVPAASGGSVAILGAGNCNDVDLRELAQRFDALHLVDIDVDACQTALEQQPVQAQLHAADLSGVLGRLHHWREHPPDPVALRAVPEAARVAVAQQLPGPFDVVVSAGVISQLVWSCMECFGLDHPSLRAVALTAMMAHITIALDQTRPGGTFVLAVDTVARAPDVLDAMAQEMPLADLLFTLEATRQCLPGTEASLVAAALRHVAPGAELILSSPWLWSISETRSSVVYGIVTTKT